MSLYERAKAGVRVDSEMSDEFEVKVGMCWGSVLSPFLLTFVVDVAIELASVGVVGDLLYAGDLVLMSETINCLRNKNKKCNEALESNGLKVYLGKTKLTVSWSNR